VETRRCERQNGTSAVVRGRAEHGAAAPCGKRRPRCYGQPRQRAARSTSLGSATPEAWPAVEDHESRRAAGIRPKQVDSFVRRMRSPPARARHPAGASTGMSGNKVPWHHHPHDQRIERKPVECSVVRAASRSSSCKMGRLRRIPVEQQPHIASDSRHSEPSRRTLAT